MTNEELAVLIREGRTDLYLELWNQVERFVRSRARFRLHGGAFDNGEDGRGGVELDDLTQAGFIAMTKAVKTFSPGDGSFLTWLSFCLKNAFNEAQGIRTSKRDPLDNCVSLDRPVNEEDDETIADFIRASDSLKNVDARIYREELHAAFEKALAEIPERQASMIRKVFFEGRTLDSAGAAIGVTRERARQIQNDGLRSLQRCKELRQFLADEINYYLSVGPRRFNTTGQSSTELLALKRMALEEKYAALMRGYERR